MRWSKSVRREWWPLVLRVIAGCGFMEHGFAKLSRGTDAFTDVLQALSVPLPHLMAWATILTELFGGLAILLGAFVWVVSIPLATVLLTAIVTVHLQYGFSSIKLMAVTPDGPQFGPPGYETGLLYLGCLVVLVMAGTGPWSVDGVIARGSMDGGRSAPQSDREDI